MVICILFAMFSFHYYSQIHLSFQSFHYHCYSRLHLSFHRAHQQIFKLLVLLTRVTLFICFKHLITRVSWHFNLNDPLVKKKNKNAKTTSKIQVTIFNNRSTTNFSILTKIRTTSKLTSNYLQFNYEFRRNLT